MPLPKPSPEQQALIDGFVKGQNVISNSAAGSGKSTTGLNLIDAYLEKNPNKHVLLVAFQKNVQQEFERKAKDNLSEDKQTFLTIKTSYSLGLALLKQRYPYLRNPETFKANLIVAKLLGGVYARKGGRDSLMATTLYGMWEDTKRALIGLYNVSQARMLSTLEDVKQLEIERNIFTTAPSHDILDVVVRAIAIAQQELEEHNKYDFIDMVSIPARLGLVADFKYDAIVVDEAQDLSPAQRAVVVAHAHANTQFAFLGDRSQAIMQFAGATTTTMDDLKSTFNAVEYRIPTSYRIPIKVRDLARQFVPDLQARPNAPTGWVGNIGVTKAVAKMEAGDLVIARNVASLLEVAVITMASQKKVRFRGNDIKGQVQDAIAAIERVWGLKNFPYGVTEYVAQYIKMIHDKHGVDGTETQVDEIRKLGIGLNALYAHANSLGFGGEKFPQWVTGLFDEKIKGGVIEFLSIHQSKGGEANNVFIILPEGGLPYRTNKMSPLQRIEEDNVAYVAYTRAKNSLWLVVPDSEEKPLAQSEPEVTKEEYLSPEGRFIKKTEWANIQLIDVYEKYIHLVGDYKMDSSALRELKIANLQQQVKNSLIEANRESDWNKLAIKLGLTKQPNLL